MAILHRPTPPGFSLPHRGGGVETGQNFWHDHQGGAEMDIGCPAQIHPGYIYKNTPNFNNISKIPLTYIFFVMYLDFLLFCQRIWSEMACIRLLVLMIWFVLLSIKAWMFKTLLYCHLRYLIVIYIYIYIYIYISSGRVTPILGAGRIRGGISCLDMWDWSCTGLDFHCAGRAGAPMIGLRSAPLPPLGSNQRFMGGLTCVNEHPHLFFISINKNDFLIFF